MKFKNSWRLFFCMSIHRAQRDLGGYIFTNKVSKLERLFKASRNSEIVVTVSHCEEKLFHL